MSVIQTATMPTRQPRREGEEPWLHHLPGARVVDDRGAWLIEAVRDRSVAHLGFADIGCELTRDLDGSWVHARLAAAASRLVGLDVSTEAVADARSRGFAAHAVDCTSSADVRAIALEPFDVVLAGELIEHVDNPGGLLDAAHVLMAADGLLIVTTPNARRLMDTLLAVARRELVHPDHVAVYSARTLSSLLERHGWEVIELFVYMNPRSRRRARTAKEVILRMGDAFERALANTVSPYVADGLIAVARRRRES
jgi:2-polyprenyl-3-methyl-5-hydroxy-6-metoxy-1,4-benzoquinol methylase